MQSDSSQPKYDSAGLQTYHYVPFLSDGRFEDAYKKAIYPLDPSEVDLRYIGYIISWSISQVSNIKGDFVECGTYNAKVATFILNMVDLRGAGRRMHLFDTFSGIPGEDLSQREKALGFEGRYNDTSLEEVKEKLKDYLDIIHFYVGKIPVTLGCFVKNPIAFLHLDVNVAQSTKFALEFFYPIISHGGIILFDDYGWDGYEDQRNVIDSFLLNKPENILALPTGQGLLIKK